MTVAVAMLAAVFAILLALLCFSLRTFSRSRLEELCEKRDRLSRFGEILQRHQKVLLLSESLLLLLIVSGVWAAAATDYFPSLKFPAGESWPRLAEWSLRAFTVLFGMSFFLIALPWTVARVRGEAFLFAVWPVVHTAERLATPLWRFTVHLDRLTHRVFGVPEPESEAASRLLTEELLTVVDENRRAGVIQTNASTMIHRVVDLQTEDVAAIMTPRTDMVTIEADLPLADALTEMLKTGFSRVPVIREGIDDIAGILYARDLLAYSNEESDEDDGRTVGDIAREALYAPESQGIGDLLEAMRQKKVHMAVIVDEYSGVSGLVTLEDIIEEIVGDISDEYDRDDDGLWKEHQDGRTDIDARFHLDDLNEEFGYDFPEDEEFDTIGGFVLSCFGRIPAAGEETTWQDLKLIVLDADERHLIRVRIEGPSSVEVNQRTAS